MTTWNVKEFSVIASVTIRTLHYYDKIGLLKPSARAMNGYRVYTEKDLSKLERITSLKFCGFSLLQISFLLKCQDEEAFNLFTKQLNVLQAEVSHIKEGQVILLDSVIKDLEINKELNWRLMMEFIKEFTKKQALKKEFDEQISSLPIPKRKQRNDEYQNF